MNHDLVLTLDTGVKIATDGNLCAFGDVVYVYAPNGDLVQTWNAEEWGYPGTAEEVMGAILSCAATAHMDGKTKPDKATFAKIQHELKALTDGAKKAAESMEAVSKAFDDTKIDAEALVEAHTQTWKAPLTFADLKVGQAFHFTIAKNAHCLKTGCLSYRYRYTGPNDDPTKWYDYTMTGPNNADLGYDVVCLESEG